MTFVGPRSMADVDHNDIWGADPMSDVATVDLSIEIAREQISRPACAVPKDWAPLPRSTRTTVPPAGYTIAPHAVYLALLRLAQQL